MTQLLQIRRRQEEAGSLDKTGSQFLIRSSNICEGVTSVSGTVLVLGVVPLACGAHIP